jgi:hypothetical protein
LVKFTVKGEQLATALLLKFACGFPKTTIVEFAVSLQPVALVQIILTVNVIFEVVVFVNTEDAFCVVAVFPLLKSHEYVLAPVEVLVKFTVSGPQPLLRFSVKEADGFGFTVTVADTLSLQLAVVMVSVTVNVPALV